MVNRSENDVEAQQQQQQMEIRRMIDVEESQIPVNDLLRRSQLGEIGRKRIKLLLLNQHSDHARDNQQDEQHDAEWDGADQIKEAVNQAVYALRLLSASRLRLFDLRRRRDGVLDYGVVNTRHCGGFDRFRLSRQFCG